MESVLTEPAHSVSGAEPTLKEELDRYWLRLTLVAWVCVAAWFVIDYWPNIRFLSLSDTDDNMRLMQVRGLLGGQGWYDLRNYRLNPPGRVRHPLERASSTCRSPR